MAAVPTEVKAWCIQELLKITDDEDQVTGKILSMSTISELESYLRSVLDPENGEHRNILMEFSNIVETCEVDFSYSQKCSGEFGRGNDPPLLKGENKGLFNPGKQLKKKPTRFVPLYGDEGLTRSSVRLPGRHPCECLGQKHQLVNNCTECGRIVCMQEGSGPCYFCGALVCTKEEQQILARNSKKSQKLYEKLLTQSIEGLSENKDTQPLKDAGLEEAIAHKNKLIEFDKGGVRRTKVIDDECDYFASDSNKWLSKKERDALRKKEEEMREKRHGSRRQMKVTFDFAGRKVIDENEPHDYGSECDVSVLATGIYSSHRNRESEGMANSRHPNVASLKFVPSGNRGSEPVSNESLAEKKSDRQIMRLQDKEFQEMSDTGSCLSMHQPWASLLVMGIKRVEGRIWYTAHRGRLWIASTAKQPTEHDIKAVEGMYRGLYGSDNVVFPKHYPAACLLGCVDMVDCLAQEDYREEFPEGESESPFVFICENPQQLAVKFPVKGQHKIWKLDPAIHKVAKGGLRKAA